jgi:hypothetical protein
MTCAQLGGPCALALQGTTADEVIEAQDARLQDAVARGNHAHAAAARGMSGRWTHPISGVSRYRAVKRDFSVLPEDVDPTT